VTRPIRAPIIWTAIISGSENTAVQSMFSPNAAPACE
jgi:hypothetical protein